MINVTKILDLSHMVVVNGNPLVLIEYYDGSVSNVLDEQEFAAQFGYQPIANFYKGLKREELDHVESRINRGNFVEVNILDLLDGLGYDSLKHDYYAQTKMVLDWCEKFDIFFYEKPADSFSKWEASELAHFHGKKGFVYSSLS
jgi:hypothetical protein